MPMKYIKTCICYIHGINMHCITGVITLVLTVVARLSFAEQTGKYIINISLYTLRLMSFIWYMSLHIV